MPSPLGKVSPKVTEEVRTFATQKCIAEGDYMETLKEFGLFRPRYARPPSPKGKAFGVWRIAIQPFREVLRNDLCCCILCFVQYITGIGS